MEMDASALLEALSRRGIETEVRDGMVVVRPADRLTDDLDAAIRRLKPELLKLLERRAISQARTEKDEGSLEEVLPIEIVAMAMKRAPRSVVLDSLCETHVAQAIANASRVWRTLPAAVRQEALGTARLSLHVAADLIARANYLDAFAVLDEMALELEPFQLR
jgi:hypothetical protein